MYKIYADDVLIYDSTLEDYRIGKGQITLEVGKSGSFVFSVYPNHFYYDRFVQMRTVITVYKSGRIVFRGRVLDDVTDYWNNKTLTCEGELGFLNDSIVRPFSFEGRPAELFAQLIQKHNEQVDTFKQFKVGTVDIADPNDYIARDNSGYESTQSNLTSRLVESGLGGYIYITHGADGTEEQPTIHYVRDFSKVATQGIEFGVNLKDFTKTTKGTEIATAIIPFGAQIDDGDVNTENRRLTIESVNGGKDYVYDAAAVAYRGWIFQTVTWDEVTTAAALKQKAESWLATGVNLATTIELTAIDLHLLDRSIESYGICMYVPVSSAPHGFAETMLCNRQTMDLLKPENDTVVLGYSYRSFTANSTKLAFSVSNLSMMQSDVSNEVSKVSQHVNSIKLSVENSEAGSYIMLKAGETEISSLDIKLLGVVTFETLGNSPGEGATKIDGGWIDADTLTVNAAKVSGTLWADQIKVGYNKGDRDEYTETFDGAVYTLITDELVSSPTIKGGAFYDTKSYGKLTLAVYGDNDDGVPWLHFYDTSNRVELFEVMPFTATSSQVLMRLGGVTVFQKLSDGTVALGSSVVSGNADLTATAVFA